MLATGLVDVGLPFWYSLQCRVTVPAGSHVYLAMDGGLLTLDGFLCLFLLMLFVCAPGLQGGVLAEKLDRHTRRF